MEWKRGGGRGKTQWVCEWVSGRKGNWEWEWKDTEAFTRACQRVRHCCQGDVEGKITTCPVLQSRLRTRHRLRRVWDTQHTVVREFLENSSDQLCPPTQPLPRPSSTWYSPFKRLHVISVCAGSSVRAAAHSTFSSAGALTLLHACWAASLSPRLFSLPALLASSLHLFPLFSPSLHPRLCCRTLSHTHAQAFSHCVVLCHRCYSLCSNRYMLSVLFSGGQKRDRRDFLKRYIYMCKLNCERRNTGGGGGEAEAGGKSSSSISSDAPLDTMLLCVDLVLRGKSLKWWKTTNSWHRGLMGPSSLPARKWPTSAPSSPPPVAGWQSWVPAAPLPWRTTTSTITTMAASTTGVSVTACAWACVLSACARALPLHSHHVWDQEHAHVWLFWDQQWEIFKECAAGWLI